MTKFANVVRDGWSGVLLSVLERAQAEAARGVVVFDLDSTLFDNRPRQARIVREFGAAHSLPALLACAPEHWDSGWDMKAAMRNCGLAETQIEQFYPLARDFWLERFFTSEYCADDVAIDGAVAYVDRLVKTGVQLAYVTGRHEPMREGTVKAMKTCGLIEPGGRVHLIMKPTLQVHDDDFKRTAHAHISGMGTVLAAFDNEPTHVNDYRKNFPQATVVHLATDHSGRAVPLLEGIVSVPHFELERLQ